MGARYVNFDELTPVLDWLTSQRPESVHAHFTMFRVKFDSPEILGGAFGASDAIYRLNKFGTKLAATVRGTDLVARDLADFWVVTPECNADMVGCRLCEIVAGVKDFGLDVVNCSIGAYLFPLKDVDFAGVGGREVINRLQSISPQFNFVPANDCAVALMLRDGDKLQWRSWVDKHCYRARAASADSVS